MRISKLSNKKIFSIIILLLLSFFQVSADDQPIDIWKLNKKKVEVVKEIKASIKEKVIVKERSIYDMQDKKKRIL